MALAVACCAMRFRAAGAQGVTCRSVLKERDSTRRARKHHADVLQYDNTVQHSMRRQRSAASRYPGRVLPEASASKQRSWPELGRTSAASLAYHDPRMTKLRHQPCNHTQNTSNTSTRRSHILTMAAAALVLPLPLRAGSVTRLPRCSSETFVRLATLTVAHTRPVSSVSTAPSPSLVTDAVQLNVA
jgi:hypothetical protein